MKTAAQFRNFFSVSIEGSTTGKDIANAIKESGDAFKHTTLSIRTLGTYNRGAFIMAFIFQDLSAFTVCIDANKQTLCMHEAEDMIIHTLGLLHMVENEDVILLDENVKLLDEMRILVGPLEDKVTLETQS